MRQVPIFTVIGNGRMATHIRHYFDGLAIQYLHWYRARDTFSDLNDMLAQSTHVLILISDKAIEKFIQTYLLPQSKSLILVHFSGCVQTELAYSAHPLQSFLQTKAYSLVEYKSIPFIIENTGLAFAELLPGLENPSYTINKQDKPYYHAMCVLANNFSTLFWQKFFSEMTTRFGIHKQDLEPYLQRTFLNIQADPQAALTGPLARGDIQTLMHDLNSMKDDAFYSIFKTIVNSFVRGEINEEGS